MFSHFSQQRELGHISEMKNPLRFTHAVAMDAIDIGSLACTCLIKD